MIGQVKIIEKAKKNLHNVDVVSLNIHVDNMLTVHVNKKRVLKL